MVRYAADMMLAVASSPSVEGGEIFSSLHIGLTNFLLDQIALMDNWGAWEWNLRLTSLIWAAIFGILRMVLKERGGVSWYALIHAVITGLGGVVCAYLTFVSAEEMTRGTPEPLGTVLCHGPLTSLHRVLPTAAMGYSVFDLIDGMSVGADFLSHGAVMFAFSLYMMETNKNEVLAVMLTLEFSSIFLNLLRAKFFSPTAVMANMLIFVLTFFFSRLVYGPYAMFRHSFLLYTVGRTTTNNTDNDSNCLPAGFDHVIFITSIFFTVLNAFWFYKILRKLQRKLKGKEGLKDANNYGNPADHVGVGLTNSTTKNGRKSNGHSNSNNNQSCSNGASPRKVKLKKEQD